MDRPLTCASSSLNSCKKAIKTITQRDGDEYFVFLLSDANLEAYDIKSSDLKRLLNMDRRVQVFIIFIGSMGDQATRLAVDLPANRVFTALDTRAIPKILKQALVTVA